MRFRTAVVVVAGLLTAGVCAAGEGAAPVCGPAEGALVIVGGGSIEPPIVERFVALAGGPDAEVVLIPTATEAEEFDAPQAGESFARAFGLKHVSVLHTRDRAEADTEAFVAPLKTARAVWFGGGRHWRLVDSYLGTRTQREVGQVLARGGVVGGTSAGATILGAFLVRGAREGNHIMVARDYQQGLGYLKGVTIDQHLLPRHREGDLVGVVAEHPGLLGLGLDESTAIVVKGDRFEVVGRGVVGIYDGKDHDGKRYYFLAPGERFDLKARRRTVTEAPESDQGAAGKTALDDAVRAHAGASWEAALKLWEWAEVGYKETRSSALLADMLKQAGFKVETGVAGIPTAFVATVGSGKPVIGLLGEYDALPGFSQQAVPERSPRAGMSAGHACGHHLFGTAAVAASLALAEQVRIGTLKGTIRFYGCPAEEGGSAKAFMARAKLFDDCDAVLHWHPAGKNTAGDESCLARVAVKFRFHGTSAHAAVAPEQGRSALDAVELTNHAAELLREHTPDFTRIHHVVTAGGSAPNVVPDFAEVFYYVRHPRGEVVKSIHERLVKCAEAGALATGTTLETQDLGGTLEIVPNEILARVARTNLETLNDLRYDDAETAFASKLGKTLSAPLPLESLATVEDLGGQVGKGSTDVGDVSWVVPTAGFTVATWVPGTPAHSWQAVAAGGTTIGRKGMVLAARVLAATVWDLFRNPKLLDAARAEQVRRTEGHPYRSLLGTRQKPPLDYRDPPTRGAR